MCLCLCLLEIIALCGMSESKVEVFISLLIRAGGNPLTNPLKLKYLRTKADVAYCWFAESLVVYKDIFYVFYDYGMMLKILWVIIPSHWKDCIQHLWRR